MGSTADLEARYAGQLVRQLTNESGVSAALKRSAHARIVNVIAAPAPTPIRSSPSHSEAARQRGMESAKLLWSALTSTLAAAGRDIGHCERRLPWADATHPGAAAMGARPVAQSAAGLLWAATQPGAGRAVGSSAMDSLWTAAARECAEASASVHPFGGLITNP
jgi:hypothetical protein